MSRIEVLEIVDSEQNGAIRAAVHLRIDGETVWAKVGDDLSKVQTTDADKRQQLKKWYAGSRDVTPERIDALEGTALDDFWRRARSFLSEEER